MAATTVQDLITDALVDSGAFSEGMPPPAKAVNKALRLLNMMLSLWNRKRYIVYAIVDTACVSDGGQNYTVGDGGEFQLPARPAKLQYAFARQLITSPGNPVDYPLEIIEAKEDYARISLKSLTTWPGAVFYDPIFPLGRAYFWPIPQAAIFELHIGTLKQLLRYDSLSDEVRLPEEYEMTLYYNLCVRLTANYRMAPNGVHVGLAKESLNVLRGENSMIQNMRMPAELGRNRRSKYNIYSDNN